MTEIEHYAQIFRRQALPIIRETGNYIVEQLLHFRKDLIEVKDQNSLVSYVDKTAETQLVDNLSSLFPDAGFITEEDVTQTVERPLTWIIDPLDGTTNYVQGIPLFSVSVALRAGKDIIAGAVYDPVRHEMFHAYLGGGSFLNNRSIRIGQTALLSESLIATGFPYSDTPELEEHLQLFSEIVRQGRGIRRLGSAALDLVYTACGRLDAFYEHDLNIWDIAAGILIVKEAGGLVSSYPDGADPLTTGHVVASNPSLFPQLRDLIDQYVRQNQ